MGEADKDGQVKVDFNSSKDELSTKKIRRKAEKAMKKEVKAKLYSNFVKSGTLTGGKMEGEGEAESNFVEDADLSKIRTLTDEELVKACGGRTAHKGGRHGHRMDAKLARIEEAEREYMENMRKQNLAPPLPADVDNSRETEGVVKKKKKKRKRDEAEDIEAVVMEVVKKKKSKKDKKDRLEVTEDAEN